MESNPVGSINFDANALYLEEESENEQDDKQQDNEVSLENIFLLRSLKKITN